LRLGSSWRPALFGTVEAEKSRPIRPTNFGEIKMNEYIVYQIKDILSQGWKLHPSITGLCAPSVWVNSAKQLDKAEDDLFTFRKSDYPLLDGGDTPGGLKK